MLSFAYNVSYELRKHVSSIDSLRTEILLAPVPPRLEQKLKWEHSLKRVRAAFALQGRSYSKEQLAKLITLPHKRLSREEKVLLHYKRSLDQVAEDWLANRSMLTLKTVRHLSADSKLVNETDFTNLLDYVQSSHEHPVLLAGLTYAKSVELQPQSPLLAHQLTYLFLFKFGYDVRTFVIYEAYWLKYLGVFRTLLKAAIVERKLGPWLEFFALSVKSQLVGVLEQVATPTAETYSSLWKISDRQKRILEMITEPGSRITNRKAQRIFKISQITASRDLARLAGLGLVLPHGKGRSVYYIKA